MSARSITLSFPGSQGSDLAARLELPAGEPRGYALFAHCFSCSKDLPMAIRLARALTTRGVAVLRFDFTGLGSSEGDFANTNFSTNIDDLECAAAFLRTHYEAPQLLIGHSLGGAAALAVAARLDEVLALATVNAPSDPQQISHLFAGRLAQIKEQGEADVTIAGRSFRVRRQFLDDIAGHGLLDDVARLDRPLLIFHSPVDQVVDIDHAARLYQAARHPKSFISLDGADHLVSRPADVEFLAAMLSTWALRYMPEKTDQPPAKGTVEVSETGDGRFTQEVRIGRHRFSADEPVEQGGLDQGPSPYDLLLAALGACTAMTLRLYAERRGFALAHVSVELLHAKIHAEDCADCETRTGLVDHIERVITLRGSLTAQERDKLLAIADKCPVHRTLHSEISVDTRLAG